MAAVAIAALIAIWFPLRGATALRQSQVDAANGDLSAALDQAREAADAQPYAASPLLQQALLLEQQGRLRAAAAAAAAATRKESTNWRTWMVLARIEAERGRVGDALRAYRRAQAARPQLHAVQGVSAMRILLLSYCFPPVPLIEAQVAAKVSGHLGAAVDVIAAEPDLWRLPPDHSLDGYVEGAFGSVTRVRRAGVPTLLRAQGRVPFVSQRPDALTFLNRRVLGELRRRRLDDYDLLVTRGQFHSIHLVPLRLTRRPPWVAHFSDPWVGNPTRGDAGLVRRINERREARVVEAADRLVFTSATAAEFTVSPYPESVRAKTRQVPHCFMPEPVRARPGGADTPAPRRGTTRACSPATSATCAGTATRTLSSERCWSWSGCGPGPSPSCASTCWA